MKNSGKKLETLSGIVKVLATVLKISGAALGIYMVYEMVQVLHEGGIAHFIDETTLADYSEMNLFVKALYIWFGKPGVVVWAYLQVLLILLSAVMVFHYLQTVFAVVHKTGRPFDEKLVPLYRKFIIWFIVFQTIQNVIYGVFFGLVLVCLLEMYKYGCELQIESDGTV